MDCKPCSSARFRPAREAASHPKPSALWLRDRFAGAPFPVVSGFPAGPPRGARGPCRSALPVRVDADARAARVLGSRGGRSALMPSVKAVFKSGPGRRRQEPVREVHRQPPDGRHHLLRGRHRHRDVHHPVGDGRAAEGDRRRDPRPRDAREGRLLRRDERPRGRAAHRLGAGEDRRRARADQRRHVRRDAEEQHRDRRPHDAQALAPPARGHGDARGGRSAGRSPRRRSRSSARSSPSGRTTPAAWSATTRPRSSS